MYVPGSQLLVVGARHPSTDAVARRIGDREYQEVYLDLQRSRMPQSKFFAQDGGTDTLVGSGRDRTGVDASYEDDVGQTLLNGDFKAQKRTSAEYDAKRADNDAKYARLLTARAVAVRPPSSLHDSARDEPPDTR